MSLAKLFLGDALPVLSTFESSSIDMVMTSPPYWGMRDYGTAGQIGLEPSFENYIKRIADVCSEIKRVLKPTGSLYLNLGDTYAGSNLGFGQTRESTGFQNVTRQTYYPTSKARSVQSQVKNVRRKSLLGIPWRIALKLIDDGWILRNDIIWHKTNGLPASVKDRLSNRYEHIFHFVKNEEYYYNLEAIREPYKLSSIKRFGGLVAQNFVKRESKYNLENLPPHSQFSQGRTPVPNWLKESAESVRSDKKLTKVRQLYLIMKGKVGHGHYKGGEYKGIYNHPVGKNPGDVIELPAVRQKSWMNTPGHPFTHQLTGEPQNPGDFWSISASTFRGAHFAVYPEKLCVKPILSSCPPLVCSKCGQPKREVAGDMPSTGSAFNIRVRDAQKGILAEKWGDKFTASAHEIDRYREFFYQKHPRQRVIAEGCSCHAAFEPGVVLDPFVGSGTTMKVAVELGRRAVGIDINHEYAALVKQRVPLLRDEDIVYFASDQQPMQGEQVASQNYLNLAD